MFYLLKEHNGANNVGDFVKIIATKGDYKIGAVVTAAGAIATESAKAAYICMENKNIAEGATAPLYVVHTSSEMVFETTCNGSRTVGAAYQFDADGMSITTNAASGTTGGAVVIEAPEGGKVRVKLRV